MSQELEVLCFELISKVGFARSSYIEAIQLAKNGNYEDAMELVEKGTDTFREGHKLHAQLIQKEASGDVVSVSVLLLHTEDLMMSAETFKILCEEFIEVYKKINEK